jgi:hypothetical protein
MKLPSPGSVLEYLVVGVLLFAFVVYLCVTYQSDRGMAMLSSDEPRFTPMPSWTPK